MYIGLICQGGCNKVSQTGWLKQQTFIISVQGVESQIKCWRGRFLLRAVQACAGPAGLSPSFWYPQGPCVLVGTRPSLHLYMASPCHEELGPTIMISS